MRQILERSVNLFDMPGSRLGMGENVGGYA
jgi:hypothetical protein